MKIFLRPILMSLLIQFLFLPNLVHFDLDLFSNRDIVAILLEHEKWDEMLRSSDGESTTPMRDLIAFMPGKLNHLVLQSPKTQLFALLHCM